MVLVPYALGRWMRARAVQAQTDREHAERLDATRELSAQTAAYEERTRIARELHDVIAHSVSLMVIQAGGARLVMDAEPDRAEESLLSVERAGRDGWPRCARCWARSVTVAIPVPWRRSPGSRRSTGSSPRRESRASRQICTSMVSRRAFRPRLICARTGSSRRLLTNAIKHAAPARAEVRVRRCDSALELEISDDGRGSGAAGGAGGGHGIAGMRERVALHGGIVAALDPFRIDMIVALAAIIELELQSSFGRGISDLDQLVTVAASVLYAGPIAVRRRAPPGAPPPSGRYEQMKTSPIAMVVAATPRRVSSQAQAP